MSVSACNLEGSFGVETANMIAQDTKSLITDELFHLSSPTKTELAAKLCDFFEKSDIYNITASANADNSNYTIEPELTDDSGSDSSDDKSSIISDIDDKMNSTFDTAKPSPSTGSWASVISDLDSSASTTEIETSLESDKKINRSSSGISSFNGSGSNKTSEMEIFYAGRDLLDLNANLRDMRWNFQVTQKPLEMFGDNHIQYKPYGVATKKEQEPEIGDEDVCGDCGLKVSIIYI